MLSSPVQVTSRSSRGKTWRVTSRSTGVLRVQFARSLHNDERSRLSALWAPSAKGANAAPSIDDAHTLMIKTGFLEQAYSGVFHLLPLGLRVQDKVEKLVDKHMRSLGASKLSLSSITNSSLWQRSGRLKGDTSELTKLETRAGKGYFLAPTHEEEITSIAAKSIKTEKDLPIRLYQITRKYRDERRPRQGLLRTREFLMKDLYTFDVDDAAGLETYRQVKEAYISLFDELNIPYLVAEADSGSIGGNYSHEYQFISPIGEDKIINCQNCHYVANEELAETLRDTEPSSTAPSTFFGLANGGDTLVIAHWTESDSPAGASHPINLHSLKRLIPSLTIQEETLQLWSSSVDGEAIKSPSIVEVFDVAISPDAPVPRLEKMLEANQHLSNLYPQRTVLSQSSIDLRAPIDHDGCPRCHARSLRVSPAVELGHTFHLGTRYSAPLEATYVSDGAQVPVAMGCHGIGISRTIGAVAALLKDDRGLNWPRVIAPYEVVIVAGGKTPATDTEVVYDQLLEDSNGSIDAAIDDRSSTFVSKLKDADLIGYPVIVVLGNKWGTEGLCEVQCRRLNVKEFVKREELCDFVGGLLDRL